MVRSSTPISMQATKYSTTVATERAIITTVNISIPSNAVRLDHTYMYLLALHTPSQKSALPPRQSLQSRKRKMTVEIKN